jgi:hypothetical protein
MSPQRDLSNLYHPSGVREFDRNSVEGIKKSLSHCHDVNQALIRNANELQKRLMNLRLRNTLIASIVTGLIARAPEIWHWLFLIIR